MTEQMQEPSAPSLPTLTPEQTEEIKQRLVENVVGTYKEFIRMFNSIPMVHECRIEAVRFFNVGILWAKEGITSLSEIPVNPVSPPENNDHVEATLDAS